MKTFAGIMLDDALAGEADSFQFQEWTIARHGTAVLISSADDSVLFEDKDEAAAWLIDATTPVTPFAEFVSLLDRYGVACVRAAESATVPNPDVRDAHDKIVRMIDSLHKHIEWLDARRRIQMAQIRAQKRKLEQMRNAT